MKPYYQRINLLDGVLFAIISAYLSYCFSNNPTTSINT
ncbi:hypothetical protein VCRA2119O147_550007 [Vibrio crassostreae]|nr:hypothetical protein VCRA2118O144_420014 [Vibrio crassostreae]CAK2119084.1 hypothetical protein VCRA2119O145_470005 [Vibrio crassostreae]CAK2363913.1 hypothetical protein VCRA2117O142_420025 [Vibrio crassostreae]CAK2365430.1 hypothetical protein VCRA2117O143_460025 [Vibrio crassostreae]CAK2371188.1 hypothetical protein VCRA2119O147_550007 [Vibrio crassostreae]